MKNSILITFLCSTLFLFSSQPRRLKNQSTKKNPASALSTACAAKTHQSPKKIYELGTYTFTKESNGSITRELFLTLNKRNNIVDLIVTVNNQKKGASYFYSGGSIQEAQKIFEEKTKMIERIVGSIENKTQGTFKIFSDDSIVEE